MGKWQTLGDNPFIDSKLDASCWSRVEIEIEATELCELPDMETLSYDGLFHWTTAHFTAPSLRLTRSTDPFADLQLWFEGDTASGTFGQDCHFQLRQENRSDLSTAP